MGDLTKRLAGLVAADIWDGWYTKERQCYRRAMSVADKQAFMEVAGSILEKVVKPADVKFNATEIDMLRASIRSLKSSYAAKPEVTAQSFFALESLYDKVTSLIPNQSIGLAQERRSPGDFFIEHQGCQYTISRADIEAGDFWRRIRQIAEQVFIPNEPKPTEPFTADEVRRGVYGPHADKDYAGPTLGWPAGCEPGANTWEHSQAISLKRIADELCGTQGVSIASEGAKAPGRIGIVEGVMYAIERGLTSWAR